jgi:hypothetical protein
MRIRVILLREALPMSKWLRKTRPLTVDMRSPDRYDDAWTRHPVAHWLACQTSLLEEGQHEQRLSDRPDMLTPYNSRYVADAQGLSAYAGMPLFIAFAQKVGLGAALQQHVHFAKRESVYTPTQLAECLVDAIVCGISRIENTNLLKDDPLLAAAHGLSSFPDHATLHRYISAYTPEHVTQLHQAVHALFQRANRPAKPVRVTLDFDATDAVVYGQQEEAAFGHKNARDGHREYAVECCFLGASKDVLHHQVRPGNLNSTPGFAAFLEEALARLPEGMSVGLVRLDAGYFSLANLAALDAKGLPYLMGCTAYSFLLDKAYAPGACAPDSPDSPDSPYAWQRISPDEEVCSLTHTFSDGVPRRVLLTRHPDPKKTKPRQRQGDSDSAGIQPQLLSVEATPRDLYKHFACVVAAPLAHKSANLLWQSYAGRSNLENAIKESKLGFGLEALPSKRFAANQAYVGLVFLAYNLVNWFKRHAFADEQMAHRQVKAVRQWVLCVPALLQRHDDHWCVHLPEHHPSLPLFEQARAFLAAGMPAPAT